MSARPASLLCALLATATSAHAGSLELAAWVGPGLPTYSQSFAYSFGLPVQPLPGVSLQQSGEFAIDARPTASFGAGATLYFGDALGIEARVDTLDATAEVTGGRFEASLRLPAPLPPLTASAEIGGTADLERLTPLSLNLRLRSSGHVRFVVSGGLSYLPKLAFTAHPRLALGVPSLGGPQITLPTITARIAAVPAAGAEENKLGLNAGAGLQIALGASVALSVEARGFVFGTHRFDWTAIETGPLTPLQQALLGEALAQLDPVELKPTFFSVAAGLAIRF